MKHILFLIACLAFSPSLFARPLFGPPLIPAPVPFLLTDYYTAKLCSGGSAPPNCSNSNNGTSEATAKLTVAAGCALLAASDTLFIKTGTYSNESLGNCVPSGTSAAAPTTIRTYDTNTVTINSTDPDCNSNLATLVRQGNRSHIKWHGTSVTRNALGILTATNFILDANDNCGSAFDADADLGTNNGFIFDGITFKKSRSGSGIYLDGGSTTSHIIRNSLITDNGFVGTCYQGQTQSDSFCHGLYPNSPGLLVEHSSFTDNNGYGIRNEVANDIIVRRNYSRGNGAAFIVINSGHRAQIYNNISDRDGDNTLDENGKGGIYLGTSAGDATAIFNNTIYGTVTAGTACIQISASATNTSLRNNVCWGSQSSNQFLNSGTGTTASTNNGSGVTNTSAVDPEFTNAGAQDFTLQLTSDMIAAATVIAGLTTDFLGTAIPQPDGGDPDKGAYEFIDPPEDPPGDITMDFTGGTVIQRPAVLPVYFTTALTSGNLNLNYSCNGLPASGSFTSTTFAYNTPSPYLWTVNLPTCTSAVIWLEQGAVVSNESGEFEVIGEYLR